MDQNEKANAFLSGEEIKPEPLTKDVGVAELVDSAFLAFNAGRLQQGCKLFAQRMLEDNVTVCLTLSGALTPAGLGRSATRLGLKPIGPIVRLPVIGKLPANDPCAAIRKTKATDPQRTRLSRFFMALPFLYTWLKESADGKLSPPLCSRRQGL